MTVTDPDSPFRGRLIPGQRPALVLVDLVRAYFEEGAPFFLGSGAALESAARILSRTRETDVPVVHTRVSYTRGVRDGGLFVQKVPQLMVFSETDPLGEIMSAVRPVDGEPVIAKQYASAFFGTSLASTLTSLHVDTVVIVGVSTSGCVRATAVDALQHGFAPFVVRDAVGDRQPGPHEASLFDIQAKYGEVISESNAMDYLATAHRGGEYR